MGWKNAKGYFSMDRRTVALLVDEPRSVHVLFHVLVTQAFTYRIAVRDPEQNGVVLYGEGARPWGQRELAAVARMSVNTVRRGLRRLQTLKLLKFATSKLGTIVQILNFFRHRRPATGVQFETGREMLHGGDPRSATIDPYRGVLKKDLKTLTSSISATTRQWMERLGITEISEGLAAALT